LSKDSSSKFSSRDIQKLDIVLYNMISFLQNEPSLQIAPPMLDCEVKVSTHDVRPRIADQLEH